MQHNAPLIKGFKDIIKHIVVEARFKKIMLFRLIYNVRYRLIY